MLNYFKEYKQILERAESLKYKFKKADVQTKTQIKWCIGGGAALFLVIISIIIVANLIRDEPQIEASELKQYKVTYENPINHEDYEEEQGIGLPTPDPLDAIDALNPFSSFQESIVDAFSEIILQGLELFDDYVAYTPNIAKGDGEIVDARGNLITLEVDKFYNATRSIAFALLPLVIVITAMTVLLEGRDKGTQVLVHTGRKVLLFMFAIIAMRFIFALTIDLNNSISSYVIDELISTSDSGLLSQALLESFGMTITDEKLIFMSIEGQLNLFGEIILWVAFFFLLITLLFQFIIRFFHLLIHLVFFPIVLVIGLLPGGGQFFRTYIEEVLRTIFVQPVLLIGISIALEVVQSVNEPIPKIVLGLGALSFLNIIPSIVNKFSGIMWGVGGAVTGGLLAASTIGTAKKVKQGVVQGATGGKTNSLRNLAGRAIGEGLAIKPGNTTNKGTPVNAGLLMPNQKHAGAFKKSLNKGDTKTAFSSIGMKPLPKNALEKGGRKTLNKMNPDFSAIGKVSLKDSEELSNRLIASNFDPLMGDYPLIGGAPSFNQLADTSNFQPTNVKTSELVGSAIRAEKQEVNLGNTFNTSNEKHWNHLSDWYSRNEAKTSGKSVSHYRKFTENPSNKMNILRRASSEGYFESQGIDTVKVSEKVGGSKPVHKYYQVNKESNSKNQIENARNRTAKTK